MLYPLAVFYYFYFYCSLQFFNYHILYALQFYTRLILNYGWCLTLLLARENMLLINLSGRLMHRLLCLVMSFLGVKGGFFYDISILGMVKWFDDVLRWWCDGVLG